MKQILITGAGGFVGPYLIRELQSQGYQDIFASVYSPSSDISSLLSPDHIIAGDLTKYQDAEHLIKISQPDTIFHLASLSDVGNSVAGAERILTSNTLLQYNLLEAVRQNAANSRVIAICSANEYGLVKDNEVPIKETQPLRPLNPYAVSKISQEMLALQYYYAYGLNIVIIRAFNHTGPGQTEHFVVPALASQFAAIERGDKQPEIKVGNLTTARDFTDVRDIVKGYILAADKCLSGEIYNLGSGNVITIKDIVAGLQRLIGIEVKVVSEQAKIRPSDVPILLADNHKFTSVTGWQPTITFTETLADVLEYYRNKLKREAL